MKGVDLRWGPVNNNKLMILALKSLKNEEK